MKRGITKLHEMGNIHFGRHSALVIGVFASLVIWAILFRHEEITHTGMTFVFFVYGLSFFILGFSILLSPWKYSAFKLADNLWLLAAFGITHGISEWCDMFILILSQGETSNLKLFRLLMQSGSFLSLILFGSRTLVKISREYMPLKVLPIILPSAWVIIAASSHDSFLIGDISARYLLCVPGVFLSVIALVTFLPELRRSGSADTAEFLKLTAGALFVYGLLSGFVVPKADFYPASYLNYSMFTKWVGIPVQVIRAFCGIVATYAIVQFLRVFDWEMREKLAEKNRELAEAREEVAQKEKLAILSQLAMNVANDLRNPLGVMNNAVFFLKDTLTGADETVMEYLDIIKSEIMNSQCILTDFIDFFRTSRPKPKSVQSHALMTECLAKCVVPDNVAIIADFSASLPSLKVDPVQIIQVFKNLIDNAVQAMPKGGALRIVAHLVDNVQETGNFIKLSFTDTGEGIDPENMNKIFQPLFSTKSRGIGLGLPISKNLVEANGGRIEVESEPGKGTAFTVVLPIERSNI